jgi:hypothetical protein
MKERDIFSTFWVLLLFCTTAVGPGRSYAQEQAKRDSQTGLTQIWICGTAYIAPPLPKRTMVRQDAGNMWSPDAPWQTVADQTKVFMFPWGNILQAKDGDLKRAFRELKRRNISLAVETPILAKWGLCQAGLEAYFNDISMLHNVMEKIRRDSGDLRYIAMDRPFYYGHQFSGSGACQESAEQVARRIVDNLRFIRQVFPKAEIGDIEMVGASTAQSKELTQWADVYQSVVGEPLAFLHVGVIWSGLAIQNLAPLAVDLKQRHLPFGIIYNADGNAGSDERWTQSAMEHFVEIESSLGVHPDAAIFQTRVENPTHMLPENQPSTLTHIAFQYLHPASTLDLERDGRTLIGRLTDAKGAPVANAGIMLEAVDVDGHMGPLDRVLYHTVPSWADTAVIGIRVNKDGAWVWAGDARATVGTIHYHEADNRRTVDVPLPAALRTPPLAPGKIIVANLRRFSVKPGTSFTLDVPMEATASAEGAGYVTIVFLDSANREGKRDIIWFGPSRQGLDSVVTNGDGRFKMSLAQSVLQANPEIHVFYPGDAARRPAMARLKL